MHKIDSRNLFLYNVPWQRSCDGSRPGTAVQKGRNIRSEIQIPCKSKSSEPGFSWMKLAISMDEHEKTLSNDPEWTFTWNICSCILDEIELVLICTEQRYNIHFHQRHKISCSSTPKKLLRIVEETRRVVRRDRLRSIQKPKSAGSGTTIRALSPKILTRILGTPCEKPVPTGCSTQSTLDRFVQLNSFWVGFAWPQLHENGYDNVRCCYQARWPKLTPFSCNRPSSDEHPGPPLVQKIKSSRLPAGPGGKNQKKSYGDVESGFPNTW